MQRDLALGVLPPAVVMGSALLVGWWSRRMPPDRSQVVPPSVENTRGEPLWIVPALMGVCYIGVHVGVLGGLKAPKAAADWMPAVAMAGAVVGLVAAFRRSADLVSWLVRGVVAAAVLGVMSMSKFRAGWPMADAATVLGGFWAHTMIVWWALARLADRTRGPSAPAALMLYALGASQIAALAYYSLKVGQMPAVVAACGGAAMVAAFIRPRLTLAFGGVHAGVIISQAALYQGYLYTSETERLWWYPPMLAASPLLALAGSRAKGRLGVILSMAGALVPVTAAVTIAAVMRPAADY